MKKILSLLAACFALTACESTAPVSAEKTAIDAVYATDSTISNKATSIGQVVLMMKSTNISSCPKDFQKAYENRISAWSKLESIEKKMYAKDQKKALSDVSDFLDTYGSDRGKAFVNLKLKWAEFAADIDKASSEIISANAELITSGIKYSAVYPKSGGIAFWK